MTKKPRQFSSASDDTLFAVLRDAADVDACDVAFEELFHRYRGKVFAWCLRILGDEESAADQTQEVFLSLMQKPRSYAAQERFGAWLYVLTRNRCLNAVRRLKHEAPSQMDQELVEMLRDASDPYADAERGQLSRRVQEVCSRVLDPREQEIIHLRFAWGLKVDEITRILELGNSSGARTYLRNAESKLRRALARLHRELSPEAEDEE